MISNHYNWVDGAKLEEHTKRKHKILSEYIFAYLVTRCQLPWQRKLRLVIVDGFAGGGRYNGGALGSPLIFIESLKRAIKAINAKRQEQRGVPIEISCLLIMNDKASDAIECLRKNVDAELERIKAECPALGIEPHYFTEAFEDSYPKIKSLIYLHKMAKNTLFNLDPYGYTDVKIATLKDIMTSYAAPEIFYTFMINALLAYLPFNDPKELRKRIAPFDLTKDDLSVLENNINTKLQYLGCFERLVFDLFKSCASYVSPFLITNPNGWSYWLLHFSKSYRARQVYNNILHKNAGLLAHFGRAGLDMLSYNPDNGQLYLFNHLGREQSANHLANDIPHFLEQQKDGILVEEFYKRIYNQTPAHSEDILRAITLNPDIGVKTIHGGMRRVAGTIRPDDILELSVQKSFSWSPLLKKK